LEFSNCARTAMMSCSWVSTGWDVGRMVIETSVAAGRRLPWGGISNCLQVKKLVCSVVKNKAEGIEV
jgi:hypothetical protein